jgi:hypothetical protein
MRTPFFLLVLLAACGHAAATPAVPPPKPTAAAAVAPKEQRAPAFGPEAIDAALRDAWKSGGVAPAPRADDATFLRRAYVDIAGTIPPPDVTARFLADASPDKRKKLVDELLASPATPTLDELLGRCPHGAGGEGARGRSHGLSLLAARTLRGECAVGSHGPRSRLGHRSE